MKKRARARRTAARAENETIAASPPAAASGESTLGATARDDASPRKTAPTRMSTRRAASTRGTRSVSPCDDGRNERSHGVRRQRSGRQGRDSEPSSSDEELSGESDSNSPTVQFRHERKSDRPRVRWQSSPQLSRISSSLRLPSYDGSGPLRTNIIQYRACKAY